MTRDPRKLSDLAGLAGVEVVAIDLCSAKLAEQIKATGAAPRESR